MLGILLIYFIGKYYYDLAKKHEKSQWGFAILGIISYYAGSMLGGVVIAMFYELSAERSIDDISDMGLGLLAIPFGLLTCWGLYVYLKNQWSEPDNRDILDADFME